MKTISELSTAQLIEFAKESKAAADLAETESSPSRWAEADSYAELAGRGMKQTEIAVRCDTSSATISKFIGCSRAFSLPKNRPPFWVAYQIFDGKTTAQNIVASNENEWYTPKKYIEAARKVLGEIDLDPASSKRANRTVKAEKFYSEAEAGESQPWSGRIWLNPPYGKLAGEFARRAIVEFQANAIDAAILLLNAHCTDTDWFQGLWDYVLCFTNHRIDFDSNGREKSSTSTHGSVFAYLGSDEKGFSREFSEFGAIVKRL